MFRRILVVTVLAGASSIGLLGGQAGAVSAGSLAPATSSSTALAQMTGTCIPATVGVGVGSPGGMQYEIVGVGVSEDPTTLATQVECKIHDLDTNVDDVFPSGFDPGPVAVLTASPVIRTLDTFVVCVRVERIDLNGTLESTAWTSSDGSPCG